MLRTTQTSSGQHPTWPGLVHDFNGTYSPGVEGVLPSPADHCEHQHGMLDDMGNEVAAIKGSPATTPGGYGLSDGEPPMGDWSSQAWGRWKSDRNNGRPEYLDTLPFAFSATLSWLSPTPEQKELKKQRDLARHESWSRKLKVLEERLTSDASTAKLPSIRDVLEIPMSYSLKSVESPKDNPDTPWSIRQSGVYHQSDITLGTPATLRTFANKRQFGRGDGISGKTASNLTHHPSLHCLLSIKDRF
jgi:hypothetical protein